MNDLKLETVKKLDELRDNLTYDMEDNYCNLINILIDYDNEAQDDLHLSDNCNEILNVLDEELLEYYLKENGGMERLFYATRELEHADSIYQVDAYGNLQNIDKEDIEICIKEAIESLEN